MPTIESAFSQALQHHQAGALRQAEEICRQVLQAEPRHADSVHLLGVLAYQKGSYDQASDYFRQALALNPSAALYHFNLGLTSAAVRRMDEAAASFQQALFFCPDFAEAHSALGNALRSLGRLDEAVVHCRLALNLRHDFSEAHANLGLVLAEQGKLGEAVVHYQKALRLDPNYAKVHNNLGNALNQLRKLDEAMDHYRRALAVRPEYAEAHCNLANALTIKGRVVEAGAHAEQALRLRPDFAEAHHNMGGALQSQGRLKEALRHYNEALRLRPGYPETRLSRGLLYLLQGDFERGWPEYESRWEQPDAVRRPFAQPQWDGSPLDGRTILLHAEQGLGDTLQFIRYAPLVKQHGGNVIVECQPALLPLFRDCAGIDRLLPRGSPLPTFDVHAPLLSLPGILNSTLDNIPATVPYLHADPALVEHWKRELDPLWGFKVGIAWQGRPEFRYDSQRSIPLAYFAQLAQVENVRLVSLQKGPGTEQLVEASSQVPVHNFGSDLDETAGAFMDTAAVMMNLDLVITSDSAVAHLAGALGVAVWLALPLVPDWRWLLHREDSPWYPTMHLVRQNYLDGWDEVFERLATELEACIKGQQAKVGG